MGCIRVGQKSHPDRVLLTNPPAPPAGLAQRVDRVAGLIEQQDRKLQQVEPDGAELRMGDADLHPVLQLPLVPGLALLRRHLRPQDFRANAFTS